MKPRKLSHLSEVQGRFEQRNEAYSNIRRVSSTKSDAEIRQMSEFPSIIYFGNEQLAQGLDHPITPILDALLKNNYPIKAIFVNHNPHQKTRFKRIPRAVELAKQHNIPFYTPHDKKSLTATLMPILAQLPQAPIGILAAYNIIIPDEVLQAFEPIGILNLHPSLLPKYRGSTPIETAILNDDTTTGISIMKLDKAMDSGPLYAQTKIDIPKDISKQNLYETLVTTGANTLIDLLPNIQHLTPKPQPSTGATYTQKLSKSLSPLQPDQKSAPELSREIRAYQNFPKSKLSLSELPCTITAAHVANTPSTSLDPQCADGQYLIIDRLIPPNSKEMTAQDFLNGHPR